MGLLVLWAAADVKLPGKASSVPLVPRCVATDGPGCPGWVA